MAKKAKNQDNARENNHQNTLGIAETNGAQVIRAQDQMKNKKDGGGKPGNNAQNAR